ncbi:MAG: hypothetical protein KAU99_01935 [Thermoplasmata archaeon]|nr:hypothetical protein [Thermoplasmata archaeon]
MMAGSFLSRECGVVFLVGSGRSGKTATAFWMCEHELKDRRKAMYRYNEALLPSEDYYCVSSVDEVEIGDVLMVDDTALHLPARSWASKANRLFVSWLAVSSHKDILVLVLIQNTALLELRLFSSQDCALVQKWMDWTVVSSEREEFKGQLLVGNVLLDKEAERLGCDRRVLSYVHQEASYYRSGLVSFWDDGLSKPYRDVSIEALLEGSLEVIR